MASKSLMAWRTDAWSAFDELEERSSSGRQSEAGQAVPDAAAELFIHDVALRAFQGFVRALHTQTLDVIADGTHNETYRTLLRESLAQSRALDRHNAQPNSIEDDFSRFGLDIWSHVDRERSGNDERRKKLWALITWRNAIAHDEIDAKLARGALNPVTVSLGTCRSWRSALNVLSASLDKVTADHCQTLGLPRPW